MKISIIMPVYNSAQYLKESISSIINQTYRDFELLLIDDGSVDNSWNICQQYARNDQRIRIIHQENKGVSQVRNLGISLCSGDYIRFIDADDTIPIDSLAYLISPIQTNKKIDLVIGRFNSNDSTIYTGTDKKGLYDIKELAVDYLKYARSFYYGVIWNKLYVTDIIKKHGIMFDQNLQWSEDLLFNLEYFKYCANLYYTNDSVYYYYRRTGSLSKAAGLYNESQVLTCEVMRFEAIRNFISKVYPSKQINSKTYDYLFSVLNLIFNNIINTSQYTYSEKYKKVHLVVNNKKIQEYISEYNIRNPYMLNRLMIWMIKRNKYKLLTLFYELKRLIRKNKKIRSKLISDKSVLPKFPL